VIDWKCLRFSFAMTACGIGGFIAFIATLSFIQEHFGPRAFAATFIAIGFAIFWATLYFACRATKTGIVVEVGDE
jgi:hypothetical protein